MNNKLKIIVSVLIILIIILSILLILSYVNNPNRYENRKIIQTTIYSDSLNKDFTEKNFIKLDDLTINLTHIGYYPDGNEDMSNDNVIDFTLEFENTNLDINSLSFDYIISDNNYRILNTSFWDNVENNKSYMKGFVKEHYQENAFYKLNDHSIFETRTSHNNITNNPKIFSQTIISSLKENIDDVKQINIIITNLRYQFVSSEYKTLGNTDLEFILDFNL